MTRIMQITFTLASTLLSSSLLFATHVAAQNSQIAAPPLQAASTLTGSSQPFAVKVAGSGQPVILIPGLSSSGATFDGTVDHLKSSYQCHVLTLAGFAGVPAIPGETGGHMLTDVEDALARYIQANHLQHPVLIGHSLGGFIALEFAERYPGLAGDLVIVDALPFTSGAMFQVKDVDTAKPVAEGMRAGMSNISQENYEASVKQGTYTRGMVTSDADFAKIVQWGLGTDRKVAAEGMYELLTGDARPHLNGIPGRVLVLGTWAGYGGVPKAVIQQVFETQYRGTQHVQIVMTGQERHFIMFDNPAWFNQQIDSFLHTGATQRAAR